MVHNQFRRILQIVDNDDDDEDDLNMIPYICIIKFYH